MVYLFAAYTIVWVALLLYVLRLAKENRSLRQELLNLQKRLEAGGEQG